MTPQPTFPAWLHGLAIASLVLAVLCAGVIAWDERGRRQHMAVMNLVWPLCALFGSVVWLAFYFRSGRGMTPEQAERMDDGAMGDTPMPLAVAKGTSHCGAGCTLGDLVAESLAVLAPGVAVAFGWGWLFADRMFAVWVLDFLLAFGLGIAFQYFAIKPMHEDMGAGEGLWRALKADAASITAWQVGMYGAMAAIQFLLFRPVFGGMADARAPEFWLAMQAAMLCGFVTAYPVNWLLISAAVKEKM